MWTCSVRDSSSQEESLEHQSKPCLHWRARISLQKIRTDGKTALRELITLLTLIPLYKNCCSLSAYRQLAGGFVCQTTRKSGCARADPQIWHLSACLDNEYVMGRNCWGQPCSTSWTKQRCQHWPCYQRYTPQRTVDGQLRAGCKGSQGKSARFFFFWMIGSHGLPSVTARLGLPCRLPFSQHFGHLRQATLHIFNSYTT